MIGDKRNIQVLDNLINFTLIPSIYETGLGDGNFPKIRKDVLRELNNLFFNHNSEGEIPFLDSIERQQGIYILKKSFIKK